MPVDQISNQIIDKEALVGINPETEEKVYLHDVIDALAKEDPAAAKKFIETYANGIATDKINAIGYSKHDRVSVGVSFLFGFGANASGSGYEYGYLDAGRNVDFVEDCLRRSLDIDLIERLAKKYSWALSIKSKNVVGERQEPPQEQPPEQPKPPEQPEKLPDLETEIKNEIPAITDQAPGDTTIAQPGSQPTSADVNLRPAPPDGAPQGPTPTFDPNSPNVGPALGTPIPVDSRPFGPVPPNTTLLNPSQPVVEFNPVKSAVADAAQKGGSAIMNGGTQVNTPLINNPILNGGDLIDASTPDIPILREL